MKYIKNCELLAEAVANHTFIRNISKHRKEDGTLDIEGNMKLWNEAMEPFLKIKLWDKTPGYDDRDSLQPEPYLVFIPAPEGTRTKGTILIAHGGGFVWRTGCEGANTAYYFNMAGYNTAILTYRLKPYSRFDSMADMQRAIRMLRFMKDELGITERIAVMGFSAGGMLSANCATHFDEGNRESCDNIEHQSSRPDAAVIGYGAMSGISFPIPFGIEMDASVWGRDLKEKIYLAPEKNITADTPPFFIWQTMSDDGRHGMCLAKAMQDVGIPYELHIFQSGLHGVAMADGENDLAYNDPHITHWGELCAEWLEELGL